MDIYVAQTVALCISVPSVVLYVLECVVIVRHWHKSFNSSFFRLFLFAAFNNLILNFCLYIPVLRISELGWFVDFYQQQLPDWVAKAFFFLSFFTFHGENFFTVVIMAHRLSAIVWPMDFERFWHFGVPLSLLGCIIGALALTSPLFPLQIQFNVDNQHKTFRRVIASYKIYPGRQPTFNAYLLLFVTCMVFLAVSTVLNFAILLAYRWHRTRRARGIRDRADEHFTETLQFRLHVYTVAMFVGQLIHCAYYILAYFYTLFPNQLTPLWTAVVTQYIWINDLRVLVFPAWFLFWASTEVSTQVKAMMVSAGKTISRIALIIINGNGGKSAWKTTMKQLSLALMNRILCWHKSAKGMAAAPATNQQLFITRMPRRGRRWTHPLVMLPNG